MGLSIKKAILKKGLTSKEVANKMGISAVGLSQHINGNPTVDVLSRIADAIGCDVSELFEHPEQTSLKCPNCGVDLNVEIK